MGGALAYLRLDGVNQSSANAYRTKTANYLQTLINGGYPKAETASVTGWMRQIIPYVLAGDIIDLPSYNFTLYQNWSDYIDQLRFEIGPTNSGFNSIFSAAEDRSNNHGVIGRAAMTAISIYIGDQDMIDHQVLLFRKWLGEPTLEFNKWGTSTPHDFGWNASGDTWQLTQPPSNNTRVGVNPEGTRNGHQFGGIQPEDQRRNSPANYNPSDFPNQDIEEYVEGALANMAVQAELLRRAGYDAHLYSDSAVKRAADRLYHFTTAYSKGYDYLSQKHQAGAPVINYLYDLNYPEGYTGTHTGSAAHAVGFTHYTHSGRTISEGGPQEYTRSLTASLGFAGQVIGDKQGSPLTQISFESTLSMVGDLIIDLVEDETVPAGFRVKLVRSM
jgi:hypothetical protein